MKKWLFHSKNTRVLLYFFIIFVTYMSTKAIQGTFYMNILALNIEVIFWQVP